MPGAQNIPGPQEGSPEKTRADHGFAFRAHLDIGFHDGGGVRHADIDEVIHGSRLRGLQRCAR